MNRSFLSEDWKNLIPRKCWYEAMDEANDLVDLDVKVDIQGYDIDGDIVKAAKSQCGIRWCGRSDPFSAETFKRFKSSEEIWFSDHQSAIWRAN